MIRGYADDMVFAIDADVSEPKKIKQELEVTLNELGLEVSQDKTFIFLECSFLSKDIHDEDYANNKNSTETRNLTIDTSLNVEFIDPTPTSGTISADTEHIVIADSGQLEQVLMNLATNARDAMPNGGTLTIETGTIALNKEFIAKHGYGTAGKFAYLSVTDTGTGMDDNTKQKLFEPFYTTKDVGKGTGLGLSVAAKIVEGHGGSIKVESVPGEGATFTVKLAKGE